MGQKIIVDGDAVTGTCTHNVKGTDSSSGSPCSGTADYTYNGKMDAQLSDFVTIAGQAVALINSQSHLNPGETGSNHLASASTINPPTPSTCVIESFVGLSNIGVGQPHSSAGSTFVTVGGTAVLLDSDKMDTCGNQTNSGGSSVASSKQSFVACSA